MRRRHSQIAVLALVVAVAVALSSVAVVLARGSGGSGSNGAGSTAETTGAHGLWRCATQGIQTGDDDAFAVTWRGVTLTVSNLTVVPSNGGGLVGPGSDDSTVASLLYEPSGQFYTGIVKPADITGTPSHYEILSACLVEFSGDTRIDGVISTYTGGASCCDLSQVVEPMGSTSLRTVDEPRDWFGDGGLFDANGAVVLVGSNHDLFYSRATLADTAYPVQLATLRGSALVIVTDQHLDVVRSEAHQLWASITAVVRSGTPPQGFLTAYMADECQLTAAPQAWANVVAFMHSPAVERLSATAGYVQWGTTYLRALVRDLRAAGYCRTISLVP